MYQEKSLSVIIPTRDRPVLLRRALASIVSQKFEGDLEVIIVFDQSEPDYSIEETNENYRVIAIQNGRTPGLAGARNSGIDKASHDWIAFCDDDDEWLPTKIDKQFEAFEQNPACKASMTGVYINHEGADTPRIPDPKLMTFEGFLDNRMPEATPISFVAHKETFIEDIGLIDEEIPGSYGEDYDMLLRTAKATKIVIVEEPLVRIYWHGASFFFERWKMIDDALEYLLKKYPEFENHESGMARIKGQQAVAKAAMKQRKNTLKMMQEIVKLNPLEKRLPVALAITAGLSPDKALQIAQRFGKGI